MKWQPIETMPKDGSKFLIRCGIDDISIARFNIGKHDQQLEFNDYPLEFIDSNTDGSFLINSSKIGKYCIASQWMPLPDPILE